MRIVLISYLLFCLSGCAIVENNDFFATFLQTGGADDQNYTQGFAIKSTSRSDASRKLGSYIPVFPIAQEPKRLPTEVEYKLGQDIYTPEDLTKTQPILDDNPYAGWLYGRVKRTDSYFDSEISTAIQVGIIGPGSFAREVQTEFHVLCDCQTPEGWDNQLKNEPGIVLEHNREWEYFRVGCGSGISLVTASGVNLRLGNVHTDFTPYSLFKFGYGVPRYGETPKERKWSAYLLGQVNPQLIARNIFFDGNTFQDSQHVDTEPAVMESNIGAEVKYRGWGVGALYHIRTKEYDEEKRDLHKYMTITIGFDF